LDGDHELRNKGFDKSKLELDAYHIVQYEPGQHYPNLRIISARLDWECVTATHEYWTAKDARYGDIYELEIIDHNDGGSRADKYPRDENLLLNVELKKNPNSDRAHFYLAQTYYHWGKLDKAEEYYKKRTTLGGYAEEVWYSFYQLGRINHKLGRWSEAINYFMEAQARNPHRAEPYYEVAEKYRMEGKPALAYDFADRGYRIPMPRSGLFVEHGPYEYGLLYNLALTGFWVDKVRGLRAASLFSMHPKSPWNLKQVIREAYKSYVTDPPAELGFQWQTIGAQIPMNYRPMNPSMILRPEGLMVLLRTVNYYFKSQMHYVLPPDGYVRTRNFLLRYTPASYGQSPQLQEQHEIIAPPPRAKPKQPVAGLEDCRIFYWKDAYWIICSSWEYHNPPCKDGPQQCLGRLELNAQGDYDVKDLVALKSPENRSCEKNWLPLIHMGDLYLIYETNVILKPNLETGECKVVYRFDNLLDFGNLRGSAAPIPFPIKGNPGYLYVVHEVLDRKDAGRMYLHRFIWLNVRLEVQKISVPFLFREHGIEYVAGMALAPDRKTVYLGVGMGDREAHLVQTDAEKISNYLQEVSLRL
jgi:tetratricopeptide (TPR) repeat protein